MRLLCFIGLHNTVTIKTTSLLEYMWLAFGATIKPMSTVDLINLMSQLVNQMSFNMQQELVETNFLTQKQFNAIFADNEDMQEHVQVINGFIEEYTKLTKNYNVDLLIKAPEYQLLPDQKKDCDRFKRLSGIVAVVRIGLRIKFCTCCHQTFDIRNSFGTYLPKIKTSLDTIQMDESSGVFLLPNERGK